VKPRICPRKWQVEAARDGRLRGKDLDSALRHRATCSECAEEARALNALGESISRLPELARDPLATRRARQRLIAALNESVLEAPRPHSVRGATLALGFAAIAAVGIGGFALARRWARPESVEHFASVIDVRPEAGARWTEHTEREIDRVDLEQGAASFSVRPHDGRRVVVRLPDGELEDVGTVFEVRVAGQRTVHISVSSGRVAIRLRGQADFSLAAGDTWQPESAAPTAGEASQPSRDSNPNQNADRAPAVALGVATAASSNTNTDAPPPRPRAAASTPPKPSGERSLEREAAPDLQLAKAEDDTYLHIVELLRQNKYADARVEAKSYLLRFPNGFRRVEVLNIATRATGDAGAAPDAQ
jgi:ferric-dicitrate binding protein FerR (iron transport regulator)